MAESEGYEGVEGFERMFGALTGLEAPETPFPWQKNLFERFLRGEFPKSLDIPTGLGKTSVIAVWLLALAFHTRNKPLKEFPRRLVYVVNRRTVVDQATAEAEALRRRLLENPVLASVARTLKSLGVQGYEKPLAISTLRGQFADNAEWRGDPSRPSVIVGTVNMIGSRLLFSGYGCGFKSRPLHAGFLCQDSLLVHDEAHLEPAFQELITSIESEQQRALEFRKFRVMALTATSRQGEADFVLSQDDREHPEADKRINAVKKLALHPAKDDNKLIDEISETIGVKKVVARPYKDDNKLIDEISELAIEYKDSNQAILIFLRTVEAVKKLDEKLRKNNLCCQVLTGTLRGKERDDLASVDPVFKRFLRSSQNQPNNYTVYLVCTSAGEVGVNISADHLICDLTPFDSMAQRFGRVNRFGKGDARIDIFYPPMDKENAETGRKSTSEDEENDETGNTEMSQTGLGEDTDQADRDQEAPLTEEAEDTRPAEGKKNRKGAGPESPYDKARRLTLRLLEQLPGREDGRRDACPAALASLPPDARLAAFTPQPVILPATDILFDTWALTSVRQKIPGRPPVTDWLHGKAEWEPPETHVAWREEVELVSGLLLEEYPPGDLLEDYPLKPHELLRDKTSRIFEELKKLGARHGDTPFWVVEPDGEVKSYLLGKVAEWEKKKALEALSECTVLLPPSAAGLNNGMLDGSAAFRQEYAADYDVSGEWLDEDGNPRRCRMWDNEVPPKGMRLARSIDTRLGAEETQEDEEESSLRYWRWYVRPRSADDDGSRSAEAGQNLMPHLQDAEFWAKAITGNLGLEGVEALAVQLAARWHDLGKARALWQRSIGNRKYPGVVLAKSGGNMRGRTLSGYRHELGSLLDLSRNADFTRMDSSVKDLVQHLIAAHHGRARPCFSADEVYDPGHGAEMVKELARETPRRFARLQRKYGRWGLAYIESLVRAADILASVSGGQEEPGIVKSDSTKEEE